jgi:N2-acetyl-L-2,4-diaminobutanoate deacetylase
MRTTQEAVTSVWTDWEPDKEGKQFTYLKIPYSRDNSAWGSIWIPLIQYKKGKGATVLFTGGVHGGEYEGPISLMKLARELNIDEVSGRVIILPCLNLPAVQAGTRVSPVDGRDLNRSFPGRHNGTVTEIIAHYIHDVILPEADVVVDLHAGGQSLSLVPYISMHYLDHEIQYRQTYEALSAFNAPYQLIMKEFSGDGLIDYAVEKMGKVFLCAELGGAGIISPYNVAITDQGIRNILKHYNVVPGDIQRLSTAPIQLYVAKQDQYIYSHGAGIFEPFKLLGDTIAKGEIVGQIHDIQDIAQAPVPYYSQCDGVLMGMRAPGLTDRGDCLGLIATREA